MVIKEAERLCAMTRTASNADSDAGDWGPVNDNHAAKGAAVNHNLSSLSSPSRVIPSP